MGTEATGVYRTDLLNQSLASEQRFEAALHKHGHSDKSDWQLPLCHLWMNNKLFQLWRFIVLNLNILKADDHSKRV